MRWENLSPNYKLNFNENNKYSLIKKSSPNLNDEFDTIISIS